MSDDAGGVFAIDFMAGYGLFAVLLTVAFYVAVSSTSHAFTMSYSTELRPLAAEASDMLVLSQGSPAGWHESPSAARDAGFIGLSDGRPCILSLDKVYALQFLNAPELARGLGLDDAGQTYGVRVEVSADDGTLSACAGYVADSNVTDVCKCVRLVGIADADGNVKGGTLVLYLWRKYEGTAGTDR